MISDICSMLVGDCGPANDGGFTIRSPTAPFSAPYARIDLLTCSSTA
jgi:hypothetical protein